MNTPCVNVQRSMGLEELESTGKVKAYSQVSAVSRAASFEFCITSDLFQNAYQVTCVTSGETASMLAHCYFKQSDYAELSGLDLSSSHTQKYIPD